MADRWVGIDVGASALHLIELVGSRSKPRVGRAWLLAGGEIAAAVDACAGAEAIAIDAPDAPARRRRRPHHPKFTRCCEVDASETFRVGVPWATPVSRTAAPTWMNVGFDLWQALRDAGHAPMEVYPYGIFRLLHGKRPRSKRTVEGARLRLDLLRVHASMPDTADAWSHDGVDAAAAALVAWWGPERAAAASHRRPGCDDSAMWFPPLELHR